MMNLSNVTVRFHLSKIGQTEFGRFVGEKDSFQTLVLESDEAGAMVLFPGPGEELPGGRVPVIFVKWEYVSTIVFELDPESPPPLREGIGFVPGRPKKKD